MRELGYSFDLAAQARLARSALIERYRMFPDDVRLGDIANDGIVVAVTSPENIVIEVRRLMAAYGGVPTADVDVREAHLAIR